MTFIAILFGLASALTWGAADFGGGIASKKSSPYAVVFWGDLIGMSAVAVIAVWLNDPIPSWRSVGFSFLSSLCGATGIVMFYFALANGKMSIAAPVSALMAAVIPVSVGFVTMGLPEPLTMLGVALALFSIWLVARTEREGRLRIHWVDVRLPLFAGILFGFFFIFMHEATLESLLWPAVLLRISSATLLAIVALLTRNSLSIPRGHWGLVAFIGIFDVAGNVFYVLSAQSGRLDIAAVIGSLYPGLTVALAWFFLKEKISASQLAGIALALTAIVLIAV
ncbi:MAG TPA: DMT family transporter [Anaerolineales bacterium]|nr:DMT family transporter [Anaerolineales bacterium]